MPTVQLTSNKRGKGDLPIEAALRKFKRVVDNAGIVQEVQDRKYFENPSEKRQRMKKAARTRTRKERRDFEASRGRL